MILNMTQHVATPAQVEAGVVEPDPETKKAIRALMTFSGAEPPTRREIGEASRELAGIAKDSGASTVMIGGAPWLMPELTRALRREDIEPVAAYSRRVVKQLRDPKTGEAVERSVFAHSGFVAMEYGASGGSRSSGFSGLSDPSGRADGHPIRHGGVEGGKRGMILNMTYHQATESQIEVGVVDPAPETKQAIVKLLTFDGDEPPTREQIRGSAGKFAQIAVDSGASAAMIGGAPWLAPSLTEALNERGVPVVSAYSERVSTEKQEPDGTVSKKTIFRFSGLVEMGSEVQSREKQRDGAEGSPARVDSAPASKSTTERGADALADRVPLPGERSARIEQQRGYAGSGAVRDV